MLPGRLFGELHSPPRIGRRATRKRGAYAKSLASSSWSRRASLGSVRVLGLDAPQKLKEVKTWRLSPPGVGCCWKKPVLFRPPLPADRSSSLAPFSFICQRQATTAQVKRGNITRCGACQVISRHLIWHRWIFRSYALWAAGEDSPGVFAAASSISRTLRPRLAGL